MYTCNFTLASYSKHTFSFAIIISVLHIVNCGNTFQKQIDVTVIP